MQTYNTVKPCRVCHSHMRIKETPSIDSQEKQPWQFLYCERCGFGPNHAYCDQRLQWYQSSL